MKVANLCLIAVMTIALCACAGKKPKKGGGGGGGGGPKGGNPPAAAAKNPGQPGNPAEPGKSVLDDGEEIAPGLGQDIQDDLADRNRQFDDVEIIDDTGLAPGSELPPTFGEGDIGIHNGDRGEDQLDPALFGGQTDPNDPDVFDPSARFNDDQLRDQPNLPSDTFGALDETHF